MQTLKNLASFVGSHILAFSARTFSGKVVLVVAAVSVVVGAVLF